MNNKGQLTVEYILLVIVVLALIIIVTSTVIDESEKNTILYSAQIGAQTGSDKAGYAMYYNDTFNEYQENNSNLLTPTTINVVNVKLTRWKENILYITVTVHTDSYLTDNEKLRQSNRINYYVKKSITQTFNKTTDDLYSQAKSDNYIIRTNKVEWV